jgi:PAS domain S-box-containing protein
MIVQQVQGENAVKRRRRRRGRWLVRGEAFIASAGIAMAVILLGGMAASAWWSAQTQRVAMQAARARQVESAAAMLAASAESMLGSGDVTALRRLVLEAASRHRLGLCRIVLPDGGVIADAEPARIDAVALPEPWPTSNPASAAMLSASAVGTDQLVHRVSLRVPGRGAARLEIDAPPAEPLRGAYWDVQAGAGGIGSVALLCMWLVYRRLRAKLAGITGVREALLALHEGEQQTAALTVNGAFGLEAQAWNRLLEERHQLRQDEAANRAREALGSRRGSASGLDGACDAMAQGLVLVDDRLSVRYANGAAAVFLRSERDALTGVAIEKVIANAEVAAALRAAAEGTLRHGSVFEQERIDSDGGKGLLRFTVRRVRQNDSASAMLTIEDVTQQRVAEEARHAFVAQATHELRTPLTNIRLYVETALDEGAQDEQVRAQCMNVVNSEVRRLERIVGDMLSVAEIEAGSLKLVRDDVRLREVVQQLEADYAPQAADKNVTLSFELPPKLPVIQGDRDKLTLALHNLIANAVKYTPSGGRVTVTVTESDGRVTVEVADTGIGISRDDVEHVFDRFYRARDERIKDITGSGLGLALAREVARLHGGDITVESELNKGSRFVLTLPGVEAKTGE